MLAVHAEGRPDLFREGTRKYTDDELLAIFADDSRPVFVAVEGDVVLGHAFCEVQDFRGSNNMQSILSIYIDDICVDEKCRGKRVAWLLQRHAERVDLQPGRPALLRGHGHDAAQDLPRAGAVGTPGGTGGKGPALRQLRRTERACRTRGGHSPPPGAATPP